jgi:sulfatase modifying factor 1
MRWMIPLLLCAQVVSAQPLVNIETVRVGDAGNAADIYGYGAVAYEFNIGKYEVTINQYAAFLNSVARRNTNSYIVNLWNANMATDLNVAGISRSGSGTLASPYSYSVIGSGNRPISYVSWFDAARFVNWLNNGATNGASTETGAYTLNGATTGIITKNAGGAWWIPSQDEWYKAAYYKGGGTNTGYWAYPIQRDTMAGNKIGVAGSANYYDGQNVAKDENGLQSYLTDAGAYGSNSASAYGTFDQGGNVWEWNDSVHWSGSYRGRRGGSWAPDGVAGAVLLSSVEGSAEPGQEDSFIGFRISYAGVSLEGAATKPPFDLATAANWSAGGAAWAIDTTVTHDGVDSVKAQSADGQSTHREYTVTGPAVVDFWWKVSSEELYDTFSYSLNGVNQQTISGEVDWTYRTLTLPAGTHKIRWTYTKDGSDAVGQDAGWLDDFAVYPATATLQVRDGATVLSGTTTVDFGSADLGSAGFTKTLTFANSGYVPLEVQLSLPQGSPFTFDGGAATYSLLVGRGESVGVPIRLATAAAGNKSAQLSISAPDSTTAPPSITLTGYVRGPDIGLAQGATTLTSGQTFDMGLAPRTVEFTIRNNGNVGDLVISDISATGNFQITQQPATTIAPQGSTTFKVLAQSIASGAQTGSVSITSNAANLTEFSLSLSSKSLTGIAQGIMDGSMATSGTGGAVGWDFGTTHLPSGQNGQALKTGATPNNSESALEFTTQTAGILSWSWKVGSQENFDWLLCEVDGQEVAGISTKNGVWKTQVVKVPANGRVKWVYRKDTANSAGEDAGYLANIVFEGFSVSPYSYLEWSKSRQNLAPIQRAPTSSMEAIFAYLCGFDPANGPNSDENKAFIDGGELKYRFSISKSASGKISVQHSKDLLSWTSRGVSQRIVSDSPETTLVETSVPLSPRGFMRIAGSFPSKAFSVSAGWEHALGLRADGSVVAWGQNRQGESSVPASAQRNVVAIAAGYDRSVALKLDGSVVAWGWGSSSVPDLGNAKIIQVACGAGVLALKSTGEVVSWGSYGPAPSEAQTGIVSVAAGFLHALALKSDGSVVSWGALNGSPYNVGQAIVPDSAKSGVVAVAGGVYHSIALKSDGRVVGWGSYAASVPAVAEQGVIAIAAGWYHNVALKSDGSVVAWGQDQQQLAVPLEATSGVIAVSAGYDYTLALKSDGSIVAWGRNKNSDSYGLMQVPAEFQ